MTLPVQNGPQLSIDCLNRILMNLMLPPLESVDAIAPGSDHQFVATRMNHVHQQMCAKGWWSFNKVERFAPIWDDTASAYVVMNALRLERSQLMPTDPPNPKVRGVPHVSLTPGVFGLEVYRLDTNSKVFTVAEREIGILLDVVLATNLDDTPQEFKDAVVAMTSAQLGALYNAPQPPQDVPAALAALTLMDQQYEPTGNMLEDDADTLLTWMDR